MNISGHQVYHDAEISPEAYLLDTSGVFDVAEIKVFSDISSAAADWVEFEATSIHSVFQTHRWLDAWQQHVGSKSGIQPQIVIGYGEDGTIRFLLPLAIRRVGPLSILCFLGCEEASYQIGQYEVDFVRSLTHIRIRKLSQKIKTLLPEFHVVRFKRQPFEWQGIQNPFAKMAHKTAPSNGYAISLNADYQTLYAATRSGKTRSKISRRERKLAEHGKIEFNVCTTPDETSRVLDIMFAQKSKRFCEQGIANFLACPGVQDFYRSLSLQNDCDGKHSIGLHYYKCGDQVLAVILSAPYCNTEFGLINSITDGPLRHYSPGLHLLHRDIERLCHNKADMYDLGVGAHNYKDSWSNIEIRLFDTIIPTSARGYIYAYGSKLILKSKRWIKNSKFLWSTFVSCRAKMSLLRKSAECPPVDETL